MKKLLFIAGLAVAMSLAFAATAFANGGPHGGYTDPITDACAGCHRIHTAVGEPLLKRATTYALCTSCHDGTVAQTNVVLGQVSSSANRLNGGGFEQVAGAATASTHTVDGLGGSNGVWKAWGSADGQGIEGTLECASCHNPHGSLNYRILRDGDNGYPYGIANRSAHRWVPKSTTSVLDWTDESGLGPDGTALSGANAVLSGKNYTVLATDADVALGVPGKYYNQTNGNYTEAMTRFCATCHKQYWTASGSPGALSDDASKYMYPGMQDANINGKDTPGAGNTLRYRHATSLTYNGTPSLSLRFARAKWYVEDKESTTANKGFNCLTCHFAHGTSATATGYSLDAPTGDSSLLVYSERGVCRACHQKTK